MRLYHHSVDVKMQTYSGSIKTTHLQMKNQHIHSIDFIRGLCILAVILLHINIRLHFDQTALGKTFSPVLLKTFLWSGYYGVIVFFVVSGFLITTTSIRRWGSLNQLHRRQFYWIRFARIAPCLLAVLILLSILDLVHAKGFVIASQQSSLGHALFSALTFHLNWLEAKRGYLPGAWDVLWSLSVEEMFYFFFPLICCWVKKERYFVVLMLAFVVIGPFARTLSINEIWQDHSYLSCMDGIALGCLAGLWASKRNFTIVQIRLLLFAGMALSIFILIFRKQVADVGLTTAGLNITVLEVGVAMLLIALYKRYLQGISHSPKWTSPITWFGENSYEIYLTHMFVVSGVVELWIRWNLPISMQALCYLVILGLAGLVGACVAKFYSIPMNHFLRKLV